MCKPGPTSQKRYIFYIRAESTVKNLGFKSYGVSENCFAYWVEAIRNYFERLSLSLLTRLLSGCSIAVREIQSIVVREHNCSCLNFCRMI